MVLDIFIHIPTNVLLACRYLYEGQMPFKFLSMRAYHGGGAMPIPYIS